jgi:hypothetical protein
MVMLPFTVPPSSTRSREARTSPSTAPLPATVNRPLATTLPVPSAHLRLHRGGGLNVNVSRRSDVAFGRPLDVEIALDRQRPAQDVARPEGHTFSACRAITVTSPWNRKFFDLGDVLHGCDLSFSSAARRISY